MTMITALLHRLISRPSPAEAAPVVPAARAVEVELPAIGDQLRYLDVHGHAVTAYRRGRNSWVLDHTAHKGGEVLRFVTSGQLRAEITSGQLLQSKY
ncbi:hypothetical protein [Pseudarthrobacter sp. AB1]|uniref:hypothetical protein n=1 Tax=Pseudarthrobacter sp. AB1 TaxID=2138309 RepID=UPI00186B8FD5|nr:hypothetical protein [Pseudarthrobacter sp. AB1]MBE4720501.1 hypothetical protein [Pseudarthrobacter sp. AB1]